MGVRKVWGFMVYIQHCIYSNFKSGGCGVERRFVVEYPPSHLQEGGGWVMDCIRWRRRLTEIGR